MTACLVIVGVDGTLSGNHNNIFLPAICWASNEEQNIPLSKYLAHVSIFVFYINVVVPY
jgi:hypothetical protein